MTKAPHIVTSHDINSLGIILDKAFMNSEYDDLLTTYFAGDGEKYDIVINNITKRLNRIATIADVAYQNPTTIK